LEASDAQIRNRARRRGSDRCHNPYRLQQRWQREQVKRLELNGKRRGKFAVA